MQPTADELAVSVTKQAGDELDAAVRKIKHCLSQLTEDDLWWRPGDSMNGIANLILHLCGNLRQWIISGLGGAEDIRERSKEFTAQGPISKAELIERLDRTVDESKAVLSQLSAAELLRVRHIQQFDVTGTQAIFETVAHFRGHTQEIVHITRFHRGDDYEFAFVPKSKK